MVDVTSKYSEYETWNMNGLVAVILLIILILFCGIMFFTSILNNFFGFLWLVPFLCCLISFRGLKILQPQEAFVFTFFGKYAGSLKKAGFYFVNPLLMTVNPSAKTENSYSVQPFGDYKISVKNLTLENGKQKINDVLGNPVEIGIVVIWKVIDTAKAVFNVEDYGRYLSVQCDSALRNIVRMYPYDISDDGDEKSLRGSSQEISDKLKEEIQSKVDIAGIEIIEARITYLAYAQEIAAAMLQRQQAAAIIDARRIIVEGAVSMVEMALEQLNQKNIVNLDEEKKAQMVSNLLVVLCGNKDAQPIVNSGSID